MHAARRKLDDISCDQFIELAAPIDQVQGIANILVCNTHRLDRFRVKSLPTRVWNCIQE